MNPSAKCSKEQSQEFHSATYVEKRNQDLLSILNQGSQRRHCRGKSDLRLCGFCFVSDIMRNHCSCEQRVPFHPKSSPQLNGCSNSIDHRSVYNFLRGLSERFHVERHVAGNPWTQAEIVDLVSSFRKGFRYTVSLAFPDPSGIYGETTTATNLLPTLR